MEDVLIQTSDGTDWHMDLSISSGWFNLVPSGQTNKQRASVSAIMVRGSVPADLTLGVDWTGYLQSSLPLTILDSQVRESIQENASSTIVSSAIQPLIFADSQQQVSIALTTLGDN